MRAWIVIFAVAAVTVLTLASCSANTAEETSQYITVQTVQIEGIPLHCVAFDGDSAGGLTCDWDSWREAKGGVITTP